MNLSETIAAAVKTAGFDDTFSTALKLAEPKFGDLQLNGALAYAKSHGMNPRDVAQKLVDALEIDKSKIKTSIAGPGFINFSYTPAALAEAIEKILSPDDLSPHNLKGGNILIDFGSPNVGKHMHVGHFRAHNIGDVLCRLMEFCGAKLHKDNHIGDWGTTFGYIIYAIKKTKTTFDENDPNSLAIIEELYKKANAEAKEDPKVQEAVRAETAKMQAGDPENMALWKKILAANMAAMKEVHKLYGITYDSHLGESFYNDKLDRVYKELTDLGIAKLDDGALVVFHPEHPRFKEQPFIIRKSDGAANYGSTDLATMIYRVEKLNCHNIYIVTDARQSDHFEQLWITTQKWFKAKGYRLPKFHHISHGAVLGSDGKPFKTRGGESIKLHELFGEAIARATKVVEEKSPELPQDEKKRLAEAIGIGAIRYADISQNRTSDYVFDWDKMLSFEGNTAPYLLYAVARIHSLFEKLGRQTTESIHSTSNFETENEMALARKLIQMPTIIELASSDMRPHYIATYLYELAGVFSAFYNTDHIQGQPADVQNRRLLLAQKTLLVLETGLHLLGLKTVKRM